MRAWPDTQGEAIVSVAPASQPTSVAAPLALADVYRMHVADIGRWAARLGGPRVDVDDVVQEVFIVINRQLPKFRGEAKLTTWLFRITERVARNHRRWWAVRRILTPRHGEILEATGPDPLQELELRAAVEDAYGIIDRLPEKYRRVLILSELEEMQPDAIAALLEARVETVHVWLHRARRLFMAKLRDSARAAGDDNGQKA